jgi:hypothetical protein
MQNPHRLHIGDGNGSFPSTGKVAGEGVRKHSAPPSITIILLALSRLLKTAC